MKLASSSRTAQCQASKERGYILITLMLMVTLLAIAATVAGPLISFQIRRDREEEMIHRGVQYSRAVRRYYKKFGRYPVRLEELENTNNVRFLRQRYKDPITGKEFKLLHFGEVKFSFAPGIAGANPAATVALAGAGNQTLVNAAVAGAMMATQQQTTNLNNAGGGSPVTGSQEGGDSAAAGSSSPSGRSNGGSLSGQVFGGGPIVGVVSTSDKESIREFNKKNHYKDWQFIYDPNTDRGGLLNTPAQPPLQGAAAPAQPTGQGTLGGPGGIQGGQSIQIQPVPQTPPPVQPPPPQ